MRLRVVGAHLSWLRFALDICNMGSPLFTGVPATLQILPFVRLPKLRVLEPGLSATARCGSPATLHGTHPAINRQSVAGDIAGFVRQEPHHGVGNFVRLAYPSHRDEGGVAVWVATRTLCQKRRLDRAGANRIDPNVQFGAVQCRCLGHSSYGVLSGDVKAPTGVAVQPED
jgi:hypothetical protein